MPSFDSSLSDSPAAMRIPLTPRSCRIHRLLALCFLLVLPLTHCPAKAPAAPTPSPVAPPADHWDKDQVYDLGHLLDLALARNPRVAAAWNGAKAAEATSAEARAPYWPVLVSEVLGGSDQWYTPAATGPDNFRRVQATAVLAVEYLLLDFGRRDADAARTLALFEGAGLLARRQMQETVFAVQSAWFAHEAARWQEVAAISAWESARVLRQTVEKEMSTGLKATPELLTARKAEWQARFRRDEAANLVKITRGEVCLAAGLPANAALQTRVGTGPPPSPELRQTIGALIEKCLAERPDLAARAAEVRASAESVRRARADFYPEVRLEGSYSFSTFGYRAEDGRTSGTYAENLNGYGGFLTASWEIFDGGERLNRVRREEAEMATRENLLEESRLRATSDVWTNYHEFLTAGTLVEYTESWVASAREDDAALQAAFASGLEDLTTREEVRSLLAMAEYELAAAQARYATSTAALLLALGTTLPPPH